MSTLIYLVNQPWFFAALGGLVALYLVTLSLVLAIWTARDVRRRTRSPAARLLIPLFVLLFGLAGFVPYIVLRPRETLAERTEAERDRALLAGVGLGYRCPACHALVETEFAYCPACEVRFKPTCGECGAVVELVWKRCAWCGTPVAKASLAAKQFRPPERASAAVVISERTPATKGASKASDSSQTKAVVKAKKKGRSLMSRALGLLAIKR